MYTAIDKWMEEFINNDFNAIDKLFEGRCYMGTLNPNSLSEIVFRIFHTKDISMKNKLDEVICKWFIVKWLTIPTNMPISRWSSILQEVFFIVYRLKLFKCYNLLINQYNNNDTKEWLKTMYLNSACDPESILNNTFYLFKKYNL